MAETVVSESEQKILHSAKVYLVAAADDMNNKHDAMITAQKNLSNAYLNYDEEEVKATFNRLIASKEYEKTVKERSLKHLEEMLAKDFGTADWEKEVKELEDSIEVINNEIRGKQLEVTTVEQSDEYKAAKEEAEKAWANLQLAKVPADFSYEIPAAIAMNFNSTPNSAPADHIVVEGDKKFFKLTKEESATGVLDNIITPLVNTIDKDLEKFTAEWEANKENAVKDAEDNLEKAKEAHTKAVKDWKDALAKYEELGDYEVATDQAIVNKVIDANFKQAATPLTGSPSEIEKAAQTAARNAIATALHKYYTDVNAKVGLETAKFKINMGSVVGDVEKTLVDWLSDTALNGTYLNEIVKNWGTVDQFKNALVLGKDPKFITEIGENTTKTDLIAASDKAFGESELYLGKYQWLTVEPTAADIAQAYAKAYDDEVNSDADATDDEIKDALDEYTAFAVVIAEQELADAKLMPEQKTAYEAFKKALTDEKAVIEEHIADLKDTHKEADAAFVKMQESTQVIKDQITALKSSRTSIINIKNYLVQLISDAIPGDASTAQEFKDYVIGELDKVNADIIAIEKDINKLKKQLAQIEEGTYTDQMYIEYKKVLLDEATKAYEAAKVVYEDAQARLQAVIEKLTKASAE